MNLLTKINLFFKKPKVVVVTGNNSALTTEAIYQTLAKKLKARKVSTQNIPFVDKDEILVIESKIKELKSLSFLAKSSHSPILVLNHLGEVSPDSIFFTSDKKDTDEILKFINLLPGNSQLVLNFDDEITRGIKNLTDLKLVTFGFGEGADFMASDIKYNHTTNFKLNYQGNTVPIWLDFNAQKEQLYSLVSAIAVTTILNLNLVEVSEVLKSMKIA